MIQLKRILLPTDFSEYSDEARKYACSFADQFGVQLHLLHSVDELPVVAPEYGAVVWSEYLEEMKSAARQKLTTLIDPEWKAGGTSWKRSEWGEPTSRSCAMPNKTTSI